MSNYAQQVHAMRQQKRQEELAAEYNQCVYGREEALRSRQEIESEAARTFDPDEKAALKDQWHYFDEEVQRCEQQMRAMTPPAPPDPQAVAFMQKKQAFRERYGQAADQAIALAHQRAITPRNSQATTATHPLTYGHGTQPGSRAYWRAVNQELETNAHLLGLHYDPTSDSLTP